jgi:hypothetical protein
MSNMSASSNNEEQRESEFMVRTLPSSETVVDTWRAPAAASSAQGQPEDEDGQPARCSEVISAATYADKLSASRRSAERLASRRTYEVYEHVFRNHHATTPAQHRGPYGHYRLVYRYGYELGIDARYAGVAWAAVELEARPRWEERNPNTWDEFKDMIRYAWNTCRARQYD